MKNSKNTIIPEDQLKNKIDEKNSGKKKVLSKKQKILLIILAFIICLGGITTAVVISINNKTDKINMLYWESTKYLVDNKNSKDYTKELKDRYENNVLLRESAFEAWDVDSSEKMYQEFINIELEYVEGIYIQYVKESIKKVTEINTNTSPVEKDNDSFVTLKKNVLQFLNSAESQDQLDVSMFSLKYDEKDIKKNNVLFNDNLIDDESNKKINYIVETRFQIDKIIEKLNSEKDKTNQYIEYRKVTDEINAPGGATDEEIQSIQSIKDSIYLKINDRSEFELIDEEINVLRNKIQETQNTIEARTPISSSYGNSPTYNDPVAETPSSPSSPSSPSNPSAPTTPETPEIPDEGGSCPPGTIPVGTGCF